MEKQRRNLPEKGKRKRGCSVVRAGLRIASGRVGEEAESRPAVAFLRGLRAAEPESNRSVRDPPGHRID
ncbi:hypothetical protein BHE74_00050182, partial [Ensete ventricosum]